MIYRWSVLLVLLLASFSSCDKKTVKPNTPAIVTNAIDDVKPDSPKISLYTLADRIRSTDDLISLYAEIEESSILEQLMMEKGPFTVFAPSDAAFEKIDIQGDGFLIEELLKKHMVKGKISTVALTKKIRSNGGSYSMNTIGGTTLVAYKVGNIIYLENSKGEKSEIEKSDIVASNGIIHLVKSPLDI